VLAGAASGLTAGWTGSVAAAARALAAEEAKAKGAPYAGFRVGLQTSSMAKQSAEEALNVHFDLDLRWVEITPEHLPTGLTPFEERQRTKVLDRNDMRAGAYGVVTLGADADRDRAVFELARRLKVLAITADPEPERLEALEKLVTEFEIPLAIENGASGHRYASVAALEKALEKRHRLVGVCVDTAHFLRASVDPVTVVERFGDRVYGCHVADLERAASGEQRACVLGAGELDTAGLLAALRKAGFAGCLALEYGAELDDPVPGLKRCLAELRRVAASLE
jgi:sugar phosphate isomerase/epimerase